MNRILVAGIGNIFLGDDAFGCEVIRELSRRAWPEGVCVRDFGIRALDFSYTLEDYAQIILVDAISRGDAPGTVSLVEICAEELPATEGALPAMHGLTAMGVLQLARALGTLRRNVFLIGCEPEVLESETGEAGLSRTVQGAVSQAVELVEEFVGKLLNATHAEASTVSA